MKLLLVNIACINGGVEAHFALLARELARRGHSVDAYYYIDGSAEYASGKHLFDGVCRYWIGPEVSISEVLASARYDIVHANLRALEWRLVDTLYRVGYTGAAVATSHGDIITGWPTDCGGFALTAVSQYLADRLGEAGYPDVSVVHNGVDLSVFTSVGTARPAPGPVVVWVGRSSDADKDFVGLAAVAGRLAECGWALWVVDGRSDPRLNTLETWLPGKCAVLRGLTPADMAGIYRGAAAAGGCLLSTSQQEAFGLAACEAMACGCPVVAPRVGGLTEVIEDGVSGLLYDREQGADAIVEKLAQLKDCSLREGIAVSAIDRVERLFGAGTMIDRYEQVYERAAASRLRRRRTSPGSWGLRAALRVRRAVKRRAARPG